MKTLISLAALGVALGAAPAFAQGPTFENRPQVVRYADLDLASEAGRTALDRRIRAAIDEACGVASDVDPEGSNKVRRCREEARTRVALQRDQAIASAQPPSKTILASGRTGQ
jgi:UrcA family protein